jgi:transposase
MQFDLNNLPQDHDLLRQMIIDLLTQLQEKDRRIEKLSHLLACLQRSQFGRKSEQLPLEQLLFAFAEAMRNGEVGTNPQAEVAAEAKVAGPDKVEKSSGNGHGRNPLPESLPRQRVEYPLHEEECTCQECGAPLERMGEEVTRQLEYVPASFIVREHVRVKYACRRCQGNVVVSSMPAQPIEKGLPGPGLLAHVLVSKYCDHVCHELVQERRFAA